MSAVITKRKNNPKHMNQIDSDKRRRACSDRCWVSEGWDAVGRANCEFRCIWDAEMESRWSRTRETRASLPEQSTATTRARMSVSPATTMDQETRDRICSERFLNVVVDWRNPASLEQRYVAFFDCLSSFNEEPSPQESVRFPEEIAATTMARIFESSQFI